MLFYPKVSHAFLPLICSKKYFLFSNKKGIIFQDMTRKSKCIPNVVLFSKALVEWPFGTYTLVKPNAGCPSGWLEGWRYQDNEDHNNKNKMSYGQHFYGEYTRHKKKHFLLYCSYIIQVTRKQKIYILRI